MANNNDLYIKFLEERNARLERKERLSTYIYPYNPWIREEVITFCYDVSQRKAIGNTDRYIFEIKTLSLAKFKAFLKFNAKDLNLYPWLCMEGGAGFYGNVIDIELYNQCFTIRLSECLHKWIESDNELKLSLMADTKQEFHERNR